MNDTTRELGGALGVAVLGSLVLSQFQSQLKPDLAGLPASAQSLATKGLAEAIEVANKLGGTAGQTLKAAAQDAFMSGMGMACTVAAAVAVIAAIIVYRLLRPRPAPQETAVIATDAEVPVTASEGFLLDPAASDGYLSSAADGFIASRSTSTDGLISGPDAR
jgi:DHA2 family multidrug resistance protein-like MFS transporter